MNRVYLMGRLGDHPEIRYTLQGTPVAHFRIATNEVYTHNGQKEIHTEWHRIVAFGKLAELCGMHLQKGSKVFIEGRLRSRTFEDRQGQKKKITEIWAIQILFLDSRSKFDADVADVKEKTGKIIDTFLPMLEEDLPF